METELDRIEDGELLLAGRAARTSTPRSARRSRQWISTRSWPTRTGSSPEDLAKERCPKCGSPIELKTGRFGPYLACVKYKDTCDYVKSLRKGRAPDRPTDEKCHLCGSPMVIKTGRFGEFLACTTYPACKGTRAIPLGIKCPKCLEGEALLLWAIPTWQQWAAGEHDRDLAPGAELDQAGPVVMVDAPLGPLRIGRQPTRADPGVDPRSRTERRGRQRTPRGS